GRVVGAVVVGVAGPGGRGVGRAHVDVVGVGDRAEGQACGVEAGAGVGGRAGLEGGAGVGHRRGRAAHRHRRGGLADGEVGRVVGAVVVGVAGPGGRGVGRAHVDVV